MNDSKNHTIRGTVLHVPYSEKEEAKRLGARWDPDMRKWFVPKGNDTAPFSHWLLEVETSPPQTTLPANRNTKG